MSEKRFKLSDWCGEQNVSNVIDIEKQTHLINVEVVDLLNEQQATISKQLDQIIELQDKYRILEFNHSRLENRNKAQYEKIGEQQATINKLQEELEITANTKLFTRRKLEEENEQLKVLLKEAEEEIDRLKKSNQGFMETLVNNESENEDNQETEVRECQFCGEFRTEYHEYEDYSWSAEDYCNAGHDLEDTNPNSCKDYWDND